MPYFPPVLLRSGAQAGATVQAQTFTEGVTTDLIQPSSLGSSATVGIDPVLDILAGGSPRAVLRLSDIETDATTKQARIITRHYTNAEEDVLMYYANNLSSTNQLNVGGGSVNYNSLSDLRFHLAPNSTTTGSNAIARMVSSGLHVGGTLTATAWIDAGASSTAQASLRVRAGVAPTSPNDGDTWYPSAGRLTFRRSTTSEIFATGVQAAGGAATATGTWTATEQGMLQKVYDAARAFGLLT